MVIDVIGQLRPCPHVSIRFHLKTQLFLYGHSFNSVYTYPMKTINENGTFRKRSPEQNFLKTLFSCLRVARQKRDFSRTLKTHSSNPLCGILELTYSRWRSGASLSCLLYLGLFSDIIACFQANLALLILHADYSRGGKTLSGYFRYQYQEAESWISVQFDLFLPSFWYFKLFLRLSKTSQQCKPTSKKFQDGANLLFRGVIIADAYASSMHSRVSYRFQIDSSYACGRAKTP